jgi:hypothetical protein
MAAMAGALSVAYLGVGRLPVYWTNRCASFAGRRMCAEQESVSRRKFTVPPGRVSEARLET